jgi:hypothetical protein
MLFSLQRAEKREFIVWIPIALVLHKTEVLIDKKTASKHTNAIAVSFSISRWFLIETKIEKSITFS